MELTHLNQIDLNELQFEKIDCFIAASGDQPRCYYLAEKIPSAIPHKILLSSCEPEQKKENCTRYWPIFSNLGFSAYPTRLQDSEAIDKLLNEICNIPAHHLNIVVDYSCMPKKWYALLIDSITRNNYLASRVNLLLSYTPKVFEKKSGKQNIDYFGPILFNRDNLKERKPVSMIASLDNTQHSIMEALSKVKPHKLLAFIPHCTHDPEYTHLVLENNKSLLERLDKNSIIHYDVDRPEEINTLLTSYCLDERIASEVMIVPQGPKTFSMMSMLLSVRYPDLKLWEVIVSEHKTTSDHGLPVADPIIVKATFMNEEDAFDE